MKMNAVPVIVFILMAIFELGYGQTTAPSPAAEAPSSDGKTIDQGIAYFLLLTALGITYLIH